MAISSRRRASAHEAKLLRARRFQRLLIEAMGREFPHRPRPSDEDVIAIAHALSSALAERIGALAVLACAGQEPGN
jgi:hypothetical protein